MPLGEIMNTYVSPFALAFIMTGMGLGLTPADFRRVALMPRPAIAGLAGQLLLLPALAFLVAAIAPLEPVLAVGLIVIASCPGGVSSNAIVFAIKADLALSVTLTAIASLVTVFTIPILVSLALGLFMQGGDAPSLPVGRTMQRLFVITVLPVSLGMILRAVAPAFAAKARKYFRPAGIFVISALIGTALYSGFEFIRANFWTVAPLSFAFTATAILMGYGIARLMRLEPKQRTTIAVEVGVQNIVIAVFITLSLMNSRELAAMPILFGVIGLINIFLFLTLTRYRRRRRPLSAG